MVNVRDQLRSGENEKIKVVLHRDRMRAKPLAAHVALFQPVPLHHGAHGAVENQHALGEKTIERGANSHQRPAFVPLATRTVNGSPFFAAPVPTRTCVRPLLRSRLVSVSAEKPR